MEEKNYPTNYVVINCAIGIINRILQIVYYCLYRYEYKKFQVETIKQASLTFCILPTAIDVFMMGLYLLLHSEENLTVKKKIKKFFLFVLSMEFLFPMGVHLSFRTKYSYNSDNELITLRLVNALHVLFVSLPQILIVPINASVNDGKFYWIDYCSLIFSIIFIIWSVGYYFICIVNKTHYEDWFSEFVEKYKDEKDEKED